MNGVGDEPDDDPATELERLLDLEHASLVVWHACRHEALWDDGRRLEIIERMAKQGMEAQAIMLCHRWKLSALCDRKKHRLYRELFPQLPPRTEKKER